MKAGRTILLLVLALAPASGLADPVFFLVRHAEKLLDAGADPSLSAAGTTRAEALADVLGDAGISRIFSSDYRRTRATAKPLAERLALEIEPYDPRQLRTFADRLLGMNGRVLIVGHSNTTPLLAELLGGEGGPPIEEKSEYDRLYIIVVDATTTTTMLRYGHTTHNLETAR